MKTTESLLHMDYLQVTEPGSCEVFCGSDQEWFPAQRQRLTGCGPSAAANILFYMNRKKEKDCCGRNKSDLLQFMEKTWKYVTPMENGIPSTALFREKLEYYAAAWNERFEFFILDIPAASKERPAIHNTVQFIKQGLRADTPVAFLNLDNGAEMTLEAWHWVTIAAIHYSEKQDQAWIDICDEGISKRINLGLWLETTVQGGGFVYLVPSC